MPTAMRLPEVRRVIVAKGHFVGGQLGPDHRRRVVRLRSNRQCD